jgi:hypothetical protein
MHRHPATGLREEGTRLQALGSGFVGDGQLPPSLGSARSEHTAAILGGHAEAEAMLVDALAIVRLEGTLHGKNSTDDRITKGENVPAEAVVVNGDKEDRRSG